MYKIFEFLYRYRAFLCFVLLELLCAWMIVTYNNYQGAAFFNTSNFYVAKTLEARQNVVSYFDLRDVNRQLASQNAQLLKTIYKLKARQPGRNDTVSDFIRENQYDFISAKVVKNSTRLPENYITLNKGSLDGVQPDMGVVGPKGLVGRVKNISEHYSTVISLLHSGMNVSSKIRNKGIDATVVWDGMNPTKGKLLHVVRHHKIAKGDTIMTSEYNPVFPPGVMIGTIEKFSLGGGSSDYDITVKFSTDFTALTYVYVIKNNMRAEKDSLESNVIQQR